MVSSFNAKNYVLSKHEIHFLPKKMSLMLLKIFLLLSLKLNFDLINELFKGS